MLEQFTPELINGAITLAVALICTWFTHYLETKRQSNRDRQLIEIRTDKRSSKLTYFKGVRRHIFFGRGLFYANRNLSRKYLYVVAFFVAILTLIIPQLNIISSSNSEAILLVTLGIYFLGFLDTVFNVWRTNRT